jgi:hypothetical protein
MTQIKNNVLEKINYAYIVGIGRSGTTLLSKLLNRHRNCMVSLEIHFLIFFKDHFESKEKYDEADYRLICNFFDVYTEKHPMLKLMLNTSDLFRELCESEIKDYNSLTKFIHLKFDFFNKPVNELELLVDKNPSYTLHVDKLLRFSPEARFIYMVRDHRANILSRKQSIESRSPDTAFNSYRWLFYNRRALKEMKRHKGLFFMVKYEDLVTNNAAVMNKIIEFLALSTREEDMNYYKDEHQTTLSGHMNEIKGMKERYKKTFSDLEKPVFTDRIEKWKQDLPEKDIIVCDVICGKLAETYGYKIESRIGILKTAAVRLQTLPAFLQAVYDFYKEFILYKVSPSIKMRRIRQKNKKTSIA